MRNIPALLFASLLVASATARTAASPDAAPLHAQRNSASDLELSASAKAVPRFISYEDLLKLPQVGYTVSDDSNFAPDTQIGGVALAQLAQLAGVASNSGVVVAICNDGYQATYSREYIAAHRPLLVLKINGKPPAGWPKSHDGGSMGPYLISHPAFTPSFHVLSHRDEAQIPYGVSRIELRSPAEVFGPIAPRGKYPAGSAVWQGYHIAQQNCYRCHNMGNEGGRMARHPWPVLAAWAASDPKYFAAYVRNPRAVGADRMMPAMTQYDDQTIEALRAYFATFAARPR